MKKLLLALVLLLVLPASAMAAWGKPDPEIINIPNEEQETNFWCWPALIRQIINWRGLGEAPSQCELVNTANAYKGSTTVNCCQEPDNAACSRLGDENELKNLVSLYGGQITDVPVPTTPEEIYDYLMSKKVLLMQVQFTGTNQDHLYMIRGISWEGDEAMLVLNDPAVSQTQTVKFSEFQKTWMRAFTAE